MTIKDETKIALIQKDISNIQSDISDIKTVLREGYATKDQLSTVATETERRLLRLEGSSNMWKWLSPTFAAILGSTLTFLLIQYISNSKM